MRTLTIENLREYYKNHKRGQINRHNFYSVMVPFVEKEGELYLLFEKRAEGDIKDPGEICFPGGHIEEGETPEFCAVRETVEELGIPEENIHVMGFGDTLYGTANYTLYTTIGNIDYDAYCNMKPEETEVSEGFLVRVDEFIDKAPYIHESISVVDRTDFPFEMVGISPDYPWTNGRWNTVIYTVNDGLDAKGEERIVWGITGAIVRHVIEELRALNRE